MNKPSRCTCGRVKSKWGSTCGDCHRLAMLRAAQAYVEAAKLGACPDGRPLVFNNSLASSHEWRRP